MIVKLLPEHHLEFLSLKGGCTGSSESTLVKMPHCWKSHALAHYFDMLHDHLLYVFFSSLAFSHCEHAYFALSCLGQNHLDLV